MLILTFLWLVLLRLSLIVEAQSGLVHFVLLHSVLPSEALWVVWEKHDRTQYCQMTCVRANRWLLSDYITAVRRTQTHLFVTDASLSGPCSHSPEPLCRLSPSPRHTSLQIPWSSLKKQNQSGHDSSCTGLLVRRPDSWLTFLRRMLLHLSFVLKAHGRLQTQEDAEGSHDDWTDRLLKTLAVPLMAAWGCCQK